MTMRRILDTARKRPEQEFFLNRLYGAHVSPIATYACYRLGLTPDQVTVMGGAFGAAGVVLLFVPLGWWSLVAVVGLQLGYVLDFSDGQLARLTGRSSSAGSYLDWMTHFYIPVAMAIALATSIVADTGALWVVPLATLAALELASFAFSCKEHVLIAMQRTYPELAVTGWFQAALRDDARPSDVAAAPVHGDVVDPAGGIAGRSHAGGWRALAGEILIYPGSVHLATLAVVGDLLLAVSGVTPIASMRVALLGVWALAFPAHLFLAARRNHRLIRAVEARAAEAPAD
jgi:phosphatidylglycerophosphate synthase